MKNRKQIFRTFSYCECNTFAEFLHKMSLQGWHFKEWKAGLVFEQGEQEDITYCVEVFPKGSEMDLAANVKTEEYAGICEAAGWEFLDAKRKFCIFKKVREDAIPIVEEEERFLNVKKAAWGNLRWLVIFVVILAGMKFSNFWRYTFAEDIFHSLSILFLCIYAFMLFYALAEVISLKYWEVKMKRHLLEGKSLIYRKNEIWNKIANIVLCITFLIAFFTIRSSYEIKILLGMIAVIFSYVSIDFIIQIWRPLEVNHILAQVYGTLGLLVVISVFIWKSDFVQNTIKDTTSVFGSYKEGTIQEEQKIEYKNYESRYAWVRNKIWKDFKLEPEKMQDCKDEWDAVEAYRIGRNGTYLFFVRYPGEILHVFWEGMEEPDKMEIQKFLKQYLGE